MGFNDALKYLHKFWFIDRPTAISYLMQEYFPGNYKIFNVYDSDIAETTYVVVYDSPEDEVLCKLKYGV